MKLALLLILLATPALADDFIYFHSPTGNIHCMLMQGDYNGVRCDMQTLTQSFPVRPRDCDLDWGDAFEIGLNDRKGAVVCHGDTVMTPDSMVLGYGASVSLGDFTCSSEKTGVTCTNARAHGFTLSKASQKLF